MAGSLRNCKRCGKVFMYAGVPICPECIEKEEEQYSQVKRYLDAHPGAGVRQTSEGTGVPLEVVMDFLREGLLINVSDAPNNQLTCVICGKPISSGRICRKCEETLKGASSESETSGTVEIHVEQQPRLEPPPTVNQGRMYVLDMISKRKR